MPPRKPKIPPRRLEIIQTLKDAIRVEDASDYVGLKHRVPVKPAGGTVPVSVTIEISRSPAGLFVATCHEFPGLVVTGEGEHDVLIRAELEIRHLLAARGT